MKICTEIYYKLNKNQLCGRKAKFRRKTANGKYEYLCGIHARKHWNSLKLEIL